MIKYEITDFKLTAGEYVELPCKPPCSLYSVLLDNQLIDNPYYRENFKEEDSRLPTAAQLTSSFSLNKAVTSSKQVYLFVKGILGEAEVIFNGRSFGSVSSAERTYTFDITDIVSESENVLTLSLVKPLVQQVPLCISAERLVPSVALPTVSDLGIAGGCQIVATNTAVINNVGVVQYHDGGRVELEVSLTTLGTAEELRGVITLVSPVGRMYFGSVLDGRGRITVPDPLLWWPRGLGEPYLYRLTVTLYCGEEAEDMRELNVGLRDMRLTYSPEGEPSIMINGREFLPFGMTYAKEDVILPFIREDRTAALMKSLADAGVNTLRVSPSELHPFDKFYDLCDRYGIVAVEGISAPYERGYLDAHFTLSRTEEATELYYRLSTHPSVLLCEAQMTLREGDEAPSPDIADEFLTALERVCNGVLSHLDRAASVRKMTFPLGACQEIISIPSLKTAAEFTSREDRNLMSAVMEAHTGSADKICQLLFALVAEHRLPSGFRDMIYASQLVSAEHFRRELMKTRIARDTRLRTSYPAFNDSWPSVNSSCVDYYSRTKALGYICRNIFAPVLAYAQVDGKEITFFVCNESQKDFSGRLTYAIYDCFDKCLWEVSADVSCAAGTTFTADSVSFAERMTEDTSEYYVLYELADENHTITRETVRFAPSKHFRYRDPEIRAKISGGGRSFEITLASSAYAAGVELDFSDTDADFSDNYFDMLEGIPVRISFTTSEPMSAEKLERMLSVRSIYDIGKLGPEQISF